MSAYGTNPQATSVAPGDPVTLIGSGDKLYQNAPFVGERLAVAPVGHRSGTRIRWEGLASGNPGVFAVAIQSASQDNPDNYANITGASATTSTLNADGTYSFSIDEIDASAAAFRRPSVTAWPNNVTLTLKATLL